ncbi:hypothetical protein [Actinospica sp.]|jgi:hypothetical protein|uniref:hypothetical protein n=1 Tax=Actinospica sp. TaxID=1872142 RepID=UPI002C089CE7|nr:hypothetical protein [Actinospica sp.]HWG26318.1 hypothetical protein [Actinospica sp.]
MPFTSGGTDGPCFDADANGLDPHLDLSDNVRGSLPSADSAQHVAEAFHAAGWRVRKSSWTEFEVENTYAQLELRPSRPVHFRGVIVPQRIDDLLAVFAALGLTFIVELDDWNGSDTATYRSEGTSGAPA